MIRHEMIELLGWRYQDMTEAQQDVLSRVENIVEVAVLRERDKTSCAAELLRLQAQRDALLEALKYHQEQTRPIQRTIDAIKAAEGEQR